MSETDLVDKDIKLNFSLPTDININEIENYSDRSNSNSNSNSSNTNNTWMQAWQLVQYRITMVLETEADGQWQEQYAIYGYNGKDIVRTVRDFYNAIMSLNNGLDITQLVEFKVKVGLFFAFFSIFFFIVLFW